MSIKLWDFECRSCKKVFEDIVRGEKVVTICRDCGESADRIFTPSGVYTANQTTSWLQSVLDVVDKDNPAPHVQRFLKNPTRDNYKAWMKGEGIRPAAISTSQHGEEYDSKMERKRRDESHERHMTDAVMRHRQKDRRIEIY